MTAKSSNKSIFVWASCGLKLACILANIPLQRQEEGIERGGLCVESILHR